MTVNVLATLVSGEVETYVCTHFHWLVNVYTNSALVKFNIIVKHTSKYMYNVCMGSVV